MLIIKNEAEEYLPFKKVDQRKLRDVTKKVNAVIRHIETDDVTQTNKQTAMAVAKEVGLKKRQNRREKTAMVEKKNWKWYYQPEKGYQKTAGKGKKKIKELYTKYSVKKKRINLVIEELKRRLIAKKTKVKDMNNKFHNLGKTNYYKSTKSKCTKIWTGKNEVRELSLILKIVPNFGVISGV